VTPSTVRELLKDGTSSFKINVERSPVRIFDDEEFEKAGATLVPEGSWVNAPKEHIIIGLKELPEEDCRSINYYMIYKAYHRHQFPSTIRTSNCKSDDQHGRYYH
jgi:alanine dehydrogenase